MVQGGLFRAKRAASFGPNFRFDTAAADSSHCLTIFEEEHLGPTLLRGGAARIRDCRHHNALSTSVCSSNQAVKVFLAKGAHNEGGRSQKSEFRSQNSEVCVRCQLLIVGCS